MKIEVKDCITTGTTYHLVKDVFNPGHYVVAVF